MTLFGGITFAQKNPLLGDYTAMAKPAAWRRSKRGGRWQGAAWRIVSKDAPGCLAMVARMAFLVFWLMPFLRPVGTLILKWHSCLVKTVSRHFATIICPILSYFPPFSLSLVQTFRASRSSSRQVLIILISLLVSIVMPFYWSNLLELILFYQGKNK